MSNESSGAESREAGGPTLRGALLWAAAGTGLFLGVGLGLLPWHRVSYFRGGPSTLWRAADSWIGMACHAFVDRGLFLLLPVGAVVGLLGYAVWRTVATRGQKGGEA
jgi:hypothetical protein